MTEFDVVLIAALVPVGLALLVFWIWMLVDCLRSGADCPRDLIAWVLVIVFLKVIGAAVYYYCRYRPRRLAAA